ncbi:carboxylating nicotinate-nucleotide diphosphorylase [Sulfoacidibacillus thermotolerans]|uniref:Probable nicotinate-nucleotide pyrophosphorylase [carboxylating] n=1 Tax=Sulfoacidibacillus thermotolerans TaxID=1765684 RepID=A0A2U3D6W5_SULT2|nr:carboxylating nicotinate-nucleotide diphosphorylase [Sulfoacidibacillus thermotolerans]PWI57029.1 nicotinate-nucleotide diphosphorylase (carboxylating) [Sulfoacidibacillus thermotolerans]
MNQLLVQQFLRQALIEDIGMHDLTTELIFAEDAQTHGVLRAKEAGRIAGLPIIKEAFQLLDPLVQVQLCVSEGEDVNAGTVLAKVFGKTRALLSAERVTLNLLQRMSGIATQTHRWCERIKEYPTQIVDTRKTLPGLRMFDKYAVTVGGGRNHRFGLYDAVLIKDNHIAALGSITAAVQRVKERVSPFVKIEVEAETLEQVAEAASLSVDVILLDNMTPEQVEAAVRLVDRRALTEASGGMTLQSVLFYAKAGVDLISAGFLTHSVQALDISLDLFA